MLTAHSRLKSGVVASPARSRSKNGVASLAYEVTNKLQRALPTGSPSCYIDAMDTTKALETLRRSEVDLRARGVRRAAVFGSVARGDNRPESDLDIMVEIEPEARLTVYDYADLKDYIASLFDGPVDVVNRDGLKPYIRPAATADAIYAF